jgi:hypothetical protein
MSYLLPRAFIVLLAWGMSCLAIGKLWPEADAIIFGAVGACWVIGGTAYFGYLRKLRRDITELERSRGYASMQVPVKAADKPALD